MESSQWESLNYLFCRNVKEPQSFGTLITYYCRIGLFVLALDNVNTNKINKKTISEFLCFHVLYFQSRIFP